jgi:hypothetical protein
VTAASFLEGWMQYSMIRKFGYIRAHETFGKHGWEKNFEYTRAGGTFKSKKTDWRICVSM